MNLRSQPPNRNEVHETVLEAIARVLRGTVCVGIVMKHQLLSHSRSKVALLGDPPLLHQLLFWELSSGKASPQHSARQILDGHPQVS